MKKILAILLLISSYAKGQTTDTVKRSLYLTQGAANMTFYQASSPKSRVMYISQSTRHEYPSGNFYGSDSSGSTIFRWKDNSDTIYIKAGVHIIRLPGKY